MARLYGIDGSVKSLAGERDQNCGVESADGTSLRVQDQQPLRTGVGRRFPDRCARAHRPHIAEQPVPRVVRTLDGRARDTVALADGTQTTVRMLTYLDGIQIRETARTAAQRAAMGKGSPN